MRRSGAACSSGQCSCRHSFRVGVGDAVVGALAETSSGEVEEDVVERRSIASTEATSTPDSSSDLSRPGTTAGAPTTRACTAHPSTATDIVPLSRSIVVATCVTSLGSATPQIEPVADERRAQPFGRVISDDQPVVDDDHTVSEAVGLLEVVQW